MDAAERLRQRVDQLQAELGSLRSEYASFREERAEERGRERAAKRSQLLLVVGAMVAIVLAGWISVDKVARGAVSDVLETEGNVTLGDLEGLLRATRRVVQRDADAVLAPLSDLDGLRSRVAHLERWVADERQRLLRDEDQAQLLWEETQERPDDEGRTESR